MGTSARPVLVHWQDQAQPAQVHHLQVRPAVQLALVNCHTYACASKFAGMLALKCLDCSLYRERILTLPHNVWGTFQIVAYDMAACT